MRVLFIFLILLSVNSFGEESTCADSIGWEIVRCDKGLSEMQKSIDKMSEETEWLIQYFPEEFGYLHPNNWKISEICNFYGGTAINESILSCLKSEYRKRINQYLAASNKVNEYSKQIDKKLILVKLEGQWHATSATDEVGFTLKNSNLSLIGYICPNNPVEIVRVYKSLVHDEETNSMKNKTAIQLKVFYQNNLECPGTDAYEKKYEFKQGLPAMSYFQFEEQNCIERSWVYNGQGGFGWYVNSCRIQK